MIIRLQRIADYSDYTLGLLVINKQAICFTIEDQHQDVKKYAETRIPQGIYPLKFRNYGSFHSRYAVKFSFHVGMIEICDIPGFSDVLLHIGNTDDDTAGCILPGMSHTFGKNFIGSSTIAYEHIYKHISKVMRSGEKCYLQVVDSLCG